MEKAGIDYSATFDKDFSWRRMILWQGDVGRAHPDSLCIFVGGWDTLLMGSKREILDFPIAEDEILFAGDKFSWPDDRIKEYRRVQPDAVGPWLYVNTGPMAAKGSLMADVVDWGLKHTPLEGDDNRIIGSGSGTDMRFWTDIFLVSPFRSRIDHKCEFGQTVLNEEEGDFAMDNGRLRNCVHNTLPIFLHLNGRTIAPEDLK
jgi:hypothetical protein